jgi:uncharacterized membrane protein
MAPLSTQRIALLDLARTAAIMGMVAFHFSFDLEMFHYLPQGTTTSGFFWYHARTVAGSFLFLAGISLFLAHGAGIRWPAFWRRFAMVAGGALLVSIASIWVTPGGEILFGILHCIALASLIGLAFLRLPAMLTLGIAVIAFALPYYAQNQMFNPIWLVWTGLATEKPFMADYVPLLPWIAPLLAGIAVAKLVQAAGLWDRLRRTPSRGVQMLSWPGRHSLVIYLIHQPILVGCFIAYTRLMHGS